MQVPESKIEVKLTLKNLAVRPTIWREGGRIFIQSPFCKPLIEEIKIMGGAKWHGYDDEKPRKLWSIDVSSRNHFQLAYLTGANPYKPYDSTLAPEMFHIPAERFHKGKQKSFPLKKHQPEMVAHILQRHCCILAAEMGTCKTLAAIIAMEIATASFIADGSPQPPIWYVAPRAALKAVQREFVIWGAKVNVEFMTYEGLVKKMKEWTPGTRAPYFVLFDESSKLKNWTTQRSQSAFALAEAVRREWWSQNGGGYVVLMSGSPAPKSPIDWWSQSEIAKPGYLREGDFYKFKNRLAIIVKKEGEIAGGVYPELVSWRDDERKCSTCGKFESDCIHSLDPVEQTAADTSNFEAHDFVPSINEVAYLNKRLAGLVLVKFKKDCLDLPDKVYRPIEIKPTPGMQRAANMLLRTSRTAIEGLTRVRELSDGFQYNQVEDGVEDCPACNLTGKVSEYETGDDGIAKEIGKVSCPHCGETCKVKKFRRDIERIKSPKDDVLKDLLDEFEDIGRVVIYGGFTGTIDRIVELCLKEGWCVIRVDQGKDSVFDSNGTIMRGVDYLSMFQDLLATYPRVAFIAHPGSGGMGLTLTASPVIIYFSNDFNAENRIQSEDRIHREGMDLNRGATIIDIIHLHTDQLILDNLQKKRDLQSMTLGELMIADSHESDAV